MSWGIYLFASASPFAQAEQSTWPKAGTLCIKSFISLCQFIGYFLKIFTLPLFLFSHKPHLTTPFCDYFQHGNSRSPLLREHGLCKLCHTCPFLSHDQGFTLGACPLKGWLPLNLPVHTGRVWEHMLRSPRFMETTLNHFATKEGLRMFSGGVVKWQDLGKPVEWARPQAANGRLWKERSTETRIDCDYSSFYTFLPIILGCHIPHDTGKHVPSLWVACYSPDWELPTPSHSDSLGQRALCRLSAQQFWVFSPRSPSISQSCLRVHY